MLSTSSGETPQPRTGPLTTQATVRTRVEVPVRRSDRDWRTAEMVSFTGLADGREHIAVVFPFAQAVPLVRVHSECLTGDVFGSARCDCGPQLTEVVDLFSDRGGILLYLRQEGRGIGLYNKLEAYRLQDDRGLDTFAANRELNFSDDLRDYRVAAQMLRALGVTRIRLRTNNPDKIHQLENYGITVEEVLPTGVHRTERNHEYLRVKAEQGHTILLGESS
ncbi:GTP cyclohydrolase II [Streptomyces thermoviolaceus]|uniref:GTP cyclohydrolase II n=1 Tax=Streptomyces thermoviolaceus subsp. thermoviolaceus TaxID=66860 RepID=A0ABX0YNB3_STRTL|nr:MULTISPECIES: GTP cyclohydrolase II [Streptomyces]MCM3262559.1 GTP cyclohydrolase II [Streptomyces thermoviolaceus]NJP14022.1 GTP cyclohydrolase II [Streptomyces thermoviolaceus subsp. thermoviolaceus]RSS00614.1 GTP cyclohydrolase II [Streptomyces sp. WAC00469]WTD50374.1 GTP cyclohydrolase II [Streptomyces thermoviolaceus]GGV63481.1 GTP cyclohydrolase II [Streptomyces thermoviolaceus subsp. apingens]